jgi:hypothetical protein
METLRDNRRALFSYSDAADYCGLTTKYFVNQHKDGRGPAYVKPSERRVFFTRDALDRWMASWKVVQK